MKIKLNFFEKLLVNIFSPYNEKIELDKISGKILILKTCNWKLFENIVRLLEDKNIHALGFRHMKNGFDNIGVKSIFFNEEREYFYNDIKTSEQINNMRFDHIIIPVNNIEKTGYSNVIELAEKFNTNIIWLSRDLTRIIDRQNITGKIFLLTSLSIIPFLVSVIIWRKR